MRPPGSAAALAAAALVLAGCGSGPAAREPARPAPAAAAATRQTALPALDRSHPSIAAQRAALRHYASVGRPIYCGARRGHLVALTFDDGPGAYTKVVLRELRAAGARATFFLVGASIRSHPELAASELALGAIGSHTMTHRNLRTLPLQVAMVDVQNGRDTARAAAGTAVDLFRPPYGARSRALDRAIGHDGMVQVLWDVDSEDSRVWPPADYHAIAAAVRREIRPGSIVLMHENRGQTVRALRAILPWLARRGLRSVTVPELLAADPPSRAQLQAGSRGCDRHGSRQASR